MVISSVWLHLYSRFAFCFGLHLLCVSGEVITRLGEQLEQAGMQEVFAIPRARMPVVKFVHAETGRLLCLT